MWVDDNAFPLLSGEVHYWRLAPENWHVVLERAREMGIDVISSYVCWDFHEYAPGVFDFTGETDSRRNLSGFLDLLTEMGFWIVIRPGPYVYTEWKNAGVPDEAARYHRLHPEFLHLARRYMQSVVPVIEPYFATRGGRVILFQADNEIDPWYQWYTEQLGMGQEPGLFHEFLRERYSSLNELNRAWSSDYQSFEQARAVMSLPDGHKHFITRYLDFCRFKHWFVVKAAGWMVDTYRELGVDIPIYLNTYGTVSVQPWADMEQMAAFVGPDLYPSNEFSLRAGEHRQFMDSVRYARAYSHLPCICEFEAGIWHGWHYQVGAPSGNHYRLMCLSALAAGIAGWNWYMLVNRDNWYMSPINEWGRVRPELFDDFQKLVEMFHAMDPTTTERQATVSITFNALQQAATQPGQDLLEAFYQADIDYDFYDLKIGEIKQPLMFYCGEEWLPADSHERLRQYVTDGGHLVCLGAYPRLDEHMRPLNLLEIPEPQGILGEVPESLCLNWEMGEDAAEVRSPWLAYYQDVPGQPIRVTRLRGENLTAEELELITGLVQGDQYTVGYTRSFGEGRLTVIHLAPSAASILALHKMTGIEISSRATTPGIVSALYRRATDLYLVLINTTIEAKVAEILIQPALLQGKFYQVRDLVSGNTWEHRFDEGSSLQAQIGRKDATLLKLTPLVKVDVNG